MAGQFRPFILCEDVAEHVLNLLFKEFVHAAEIFIEISCVKDLLLIALAGTLETKFKVGEECRSVVWILCVFELTRTCT